MEEESRMSPESSDVYTEQEMLETLTNIHQKLLTLVEKTTLIQAHLDEASKITLKE